jgi:hypothetical protein
MDDGESDQAFEARLGRMFAETPAFGDAELFALRVGDRIDRGLTLRGVLIGALGVGGGMIVVVQAASSGVITQVQALPDHSSAAIGRALGHILPWRLTVSGAPFTSAVVWIPVVLAALALGFAIVRAIREM